MRGTQIFVYLVSICEYDISTNKTKNSLICKNDISTNASFIKPLPDLNSYARKQNRDQMSWRRTMKNWTCGRSVEMICCTL